MITIAILITLLYCFTIIAFILGFDRVKGIKVNTRNRVHSFSIIIPFRNEEKALPELLQSLNKLNYPINQYEIIFVDDDSTDNSVGLIKGFLAEARNDYLVINTIRESNSPKKDAITTAIKRASFDWIITTDADCIAPKNWLQQFDVMIEENGAQFIVAPVTFHSSKTFLDQFQILDLMSLQGVTIGAFGIKKPFLCNGANLCYSKEVFNAVNGFEGNSSIASGDDIFLLEKVLENHRKKVMYLKSKEAIVYSNTQVSLRDLIHQRVRWAAKSTGYKNGFSKYVALTVMGMNALLIVLVIASILGYFSWLNLLLIFLFKLLIDGFLLVKTASFFDQKKVLSAYLLSSLIYPFFSMFVAIASLTSGYQWKGRYFKK